ncbi:MAG: hypothetical protein ABIM89_06385 [Mycobacteriales bacterium]
MCCERLVCAACTAPVAEGRCRTCRSARAELHAHRPTMTLEMLAALAVLIALLMVLTQR